MTDRILVTYLKCDHTGVYQLSLERTSLHPSRRPDFTPRYVPNHTETDVYYVELGPRETFL